jgi:tetratricopeptide (TPR) repeat protein
MPNLKQYFLLLLLLSLGLMAKPMLVTLPFVVLLLDFWPIGRFRLEHDRTRPSDCATYFGAQGFLRLILEKIPLFIPVVISSILTFLAQKGEGAVKALDALSLKTRIANALVAYVSYVLKMIWPINLAVFYSHPGNTLAAWKIFGAALLIVSVCFLAIFISKKYPYIAVGLFWFLGTLVPVIGLVQVGDQAMADRYTYIPIIGLFIIVAWGTSDLFKKWHYQKAFVSVFSVIVLSALAVCTSYQLRHWKNAITLFEHTVNVTKNNYQAENNLGTAFVRVDLNKAVFHYKKALKIKPDNVMALYNLGTAFLKEGKSDEAVLYFTKALKINPQKADARMNLANVLFMQGKYDEAVFHYNEILKIYPENADAHYNLANVLASQVKLDEAVSHFKEALRINPEYSKAHYNIGNTFFKQGKIKEAVTHYSEVIKIRPDYVQAYNKIGLILAQQGKIIKAEVFFSKALQIEPNYSEALTNLIELQNSTLSK